jgi:hypothetical protein
MPSSPLHNCVWANFPWIFLYSPHISSTLTLCHPPGPFH